MSRCPRPAIRNVTNTLRYPRPAVRNDAKMSLCPRASDGLCLVRPESLKSSDLVRRISAGSRVGRAARVVPLRTRLRRGPSD
eukprot:5538304-Pyramimonas_sp.AAC.1